MYYVMFVLEISYSDKKAYGQSKLANILHANELSRRLQVKVGCFSTPNLILSIKKMGRYFYLVCVNLFGGQEEGANITVNSVHPGLIMTNLMKHSAFLMSKYYFIYNLQLEKKLRKKYFFNYIILVYF